MAEQTKDSLKAFGKEPTLPATSADFQLKLSYAQFVDIVDSALNITNGGTVAGSTTFTGPLVLGNIQSAANTDAAFYQINGTRGEIRSQLQGAIAADTGFTLQLQNSSILPTSLIVANVIGGEGGIVTGSVVTANVISAGTGSLNFFNTGIAIANNSVFTASFAIL